MIETEKETLKILAKENHTTIALLKRLIDQFNLDSTGLEAILAAREDFIFTSPLPREKGCAKYFPVDSSFSLDVLAQVYVDLGKDPERFQDFLEEFDEWQDRLSRYMECSVGPRGFPDALLKLGSEVYRKNLGEIDRYLQTK